MDATAYSATTAPTDRKTADRKVAARKAETKQASGHFTALYENERFVRFKYINHN